MKKKILIIGIIAGLILIVLGIFWYKNNKKLSKEEFLVIMNKFENVSNVKLESPTFTKYIKDEYMFSIRVDGIYSWENSKTNECIAWSPNYSIYSILEYNDEDKYFENAKYKFIRI